MGCQLQWKELAQAIYPQCQYVAVITGSEFRLAHHPSADIWRLTWRAIATNESPYSGWLRDGWFESKESATAAAERWAS